MQDIKIIVMRKIQCITLIATMFPLSASAQEPPASPLGEKDSLLKVEDFSPRRGGVTLNYGLTYGSQDNNGFIPGIIHVLAPDGSIVMLPSVQETGDRSDSVTANIGARYSLFSGFNLSAQVAGGYRHDRLTALDGTDRSGSSFDFNSLSIGADYRLTPPGSRVFANAFLSVGAIEFNNDRFDFGRSITAGVSGHWVTDPLILSTTLTYTSLLSRDSGRGRYDPGDVVTVSPSVGFAANPDINLSWGMGFAFKQGDKLSGHSRGDFDVLSTVNFGLGYRLTEDILLNISGKAGVSGNSATQFGVSLSQRF